MDSSNSLRILLASLTLTLGSLAANGCADHGSGTSTGDGLGNVQGTGGMASNASTGGNGRGAQGGGTGGSRTAPSVPCTYVEAGNARACALRQDGSVTCWGEGGFGRLDALTDVASMSVGSNHVCALRKDGSVACWGMNSYGQLGDGTTNDSARPVELIGLTGIATISAGGNHTCALRQDGSVTCWGLDLDGQLGDGAVYTLQRLTPVEVSGLTDATAISAGGNHTCALRRDGSVACWGLNRSGRLGDGTEDNRNTPVAVKGLAGAVSVSAGSDQTCALRQDGSVACWGSQEGNGYDTSYATPSTVSRLTGVTSVDAGRSSSHCCAARQDGSVACWGTNSYGQLGDGTTVNRTTPVDVKGLAGIAAVTTGNGYSCALRRDGSIACWGCNKSGTLGDGTTVDRSSPVDVIGL